MLMSGGIRVDLHGPEFEAVEKIAMQPHTVGAEEHRARGDELDQEPKAEAERHQDWQSEDDAGNVENPFPELHPRSSAIAPGDKTDIFFNRVHSNRDSLCFASTRRERHRIPDEN
jgi:hypothetical protein